MAVAIWQFRIELIPQGWLEAGGDIRTLVTDEGFAAAAAWAGYRDAQLEEAFGALLPPAKSWSAELQVWGAQEAHCIRLRRRHGAILAVEVCLDLRDLQIGLFRAIVDLACARNLALLACETKRPIERSAEQLLRHAAASSAAHFVIDPHSFLSELDTVNDRTV